MNSLKPILIITYYWPPGSSPGVQRWLKFSKYLPEFGWQPIILTVKKGSFPSTDETLLKEISQEVIVYRASAIEPFAIYNLLRGKQGTSVEVGMGNIKDPKGLFAKLANYIRANWFIPDARVGWNPFALSKAVEIIQKHKPEIIVTTGPPHSTHLIGLKLKKRFNTIPWIVDLRDPWTEIFYNKFLKRSASSSARDQDLESLVLSKNDLAIAATPSIEKIYKAKTAKIKTILNGYDDSDFESITDLASSNFNISFFGNMLPNQNLLVLWKALGELNTEGVLPYHFRLRIIGNTADNIKATIKEEGIENLVEFLPFMKHVEAVREMQKSNMLYLPIPDDEGNKLIVTGKIFEYLASERPILSIGPEDGDASEILKSCGQLKMHDYKALSSIKQTITEAIDRFNKNGCLEIAGNKHHKELTRRKQTELLDKILNQIKN